MRFQSITTDKDTISISRLARNYFNDPNETLSWREVYRSAKTILKRAAKELKREGRVCKMNK